MEKAVTQHHCMNKTREGSYANACRKLTKGPPLTYTADVCRQMKDKHPRSPQPPNLQHLGTPARALTPEIDCVDVHKA
eukprot:11713530-Karenia_brevis.AAC.1